MNKPKEELPFFLPARPAYPLLHKSRDTTDEHPSVEIHYTPTYSSWLNQVEIWFSKIQRDLIARGVFTSTTDLRRKIMSYIRLHNRHCRPFLWTYRNTKRRIRVNKSSETGH
jgi:hypothetical protein